MDARNFAHILRIVLHLLLFGFIQSITQVNFFQILKTPSLV
jgi:hypothetical protein